MKWENGSRISNRDIAFWKCRKNIADVDLLVSFQAQLQCLICSIRQTWRWELKNCAPFVVTKSLVITMGYRPVRAVKVRDRKQCEIFSQLILKKLGGSESFFSHAYIDGGKRLCTLCRKACEIFSQVFFFKWGDQKVITWQTRKN